MGLSQKRSLLLSLMILVAVTFGSLLYVKNFHAPKVSPDDAPSPESLVSFPSEEQKQKFLESNGLKESDLEAARGLNGTYVVEVPNNKLKSEGATVAPRREYRALLTPNDPIYPQWYTTNIAAPNAWDISTGSNTVAVAVIDTGFGLSHQDMTNRWDLNAGESGSGKETNSIDDDGNGKVDDWRGWDFVADDNNPSAGTLNPNGQGVSHGTLTSGLVGSTGNNSTGPASVNWSTDILALQVLSDLGTGFTEDVAAAIDYAVAEGAKVISLSLGSTGGDPTVETSINNAVASGTIVIAAAGNCGDPQSYVVNGCDYVGQMLYPAKYSNVLAVGATDQNDNRASFSSYGSEIDVVAPGSGTIQAPAWSQGNPTSLYTTSAFGTSVSTPIVAGIAALYKGLVSGATSTEMKQVLENSTDKVGGMGGQNFTSFYGYGRVNAHGVAKLAAVTHPDGTLLHNNTTGAVYLTENGQKRYIGSPALFYSYYQDILAQTKTATPRDLELPDGSDLTFHSGTVIKGSGLELYAVADISGTLYKQYIPSAEVHNTLGFSESERVTVSDSFLSSLPNGTTLSTTSRHPNGSLIMAPDGFTVYKLDNNLRRHVSSPWVLQSLNKGKYFIKPATAADMALSTGTAVDFEEGVLIKGSGPSIYVVDNDSGTIKKRHITSAFLYLLLKYQNNEWINVPDSSLPVSDGPAVQ